MSKYLAVAIWNMPLQKPLSTNEGTYYKHYRHILAMHDMLSSFFTTRRGDKTRVVFRSYCVVAGMVTFITPVIYFLSNDTRNSDNIFAAGMVR